MFRVLQLSIFSLMLFFSLVTIESTVNAQQQKTDIAVTPAILDVAARPGDNASRSITISNNGTSSLPIALELKSLSAFNEYPREIQELRDASKWIGTSSDVIIVESQGRQEIALDFTIPVDASPGGHYAQLSIRALALENDSAQSAVVIPEIVVSIFITVAGDASESFLFIEQDIFPWLVEAGGEQGFNFSITNNGNIHGLATPLLVVYKDNKEVERLQLDTQLLLPDEQKTFSAEWIAPRQYGTYELQLQAFIGGSDEIATSKRERVVVSYPPWLLGIIFFLVPLFIYVLYNRKNVKKAIKIVIQKEKSL